MLVVISPAKTLDFETPLDDFKALKTANGAKPITFEVPSDLKQSAQLISGLKKLSVAKIQTLMDISQDLAQLNQSRFRSWSVPFTEANARPALFAFNGDVYDGLQAATMDAACIAHSQSNLRILSGLYGLLKPLDLMQPYRLEMGTSWPTRKGKNLYAFWGDRITQSIRLSLDQAQCKTLVNLASEEYFKSVRPKLLGDATVVTPVFEDFKNGEYKVISFFAKRARGLMTRYILEHRLTEPSQLQNFAVDGYHHSAAVSTDLRPVFRRKP